ncbi:uncharacterized protein [Physcomitrium patens]|uniref:Plant disease resistance WDH domain-containing protein n=1 Tax=Physcomitrium patens TaxID=3218 RepID=A0A2K1LA99_PHYPA|nr:uncharacterized protein LOC112291237 [Physcomitrium patens]XP_024394161.1 uncharacterized protein LOC112291237 [Physcomitrium patens]PNR62960.1 hypothetical protein PHYPA_001385 [Physcomitrium patens]|eukprot:XP_024394152.1 uncharacterized protein LOC112291237 [Physcomitrella patens]
MDLEREGPTPQAHEESFAPPLIQIIHTTALDSSATPPLSVEGHTPSTAARKSTPSGRPENSRGRREACDQPSTLLLSLTFPPRNASSSHEIRPPDRRHSESSVPSFDPDELFSPTSVTGKARFALALDSYTPAISRAGPEISTNSPVYSSFEHLTSSPKQSSPSFSSLPPSIESLLPLSHSESKSALPEIRNPSDARSGGPLLDLIPLSLRPDQTLSFVNPLTASSTPLTLTPSTIYSHGAPTECHTPQSPPPFALPSSATSPLHYVTESDRSGFLTPDTGDYLSSSASTSFCTPGDVLRNEIPLQSLPGAALNVPVNRDATRRNSFALEYQKSKDGVPVVSSASTQESTTEGKLDAPRISLSPGSATHPRSCDVYIGMFGGDPLLLRYSKWMHAELELHGLACFSADRSLYADQRSHDIARGILHSATFGVVLISRNAFKNPYTIEELTIFRDRGNLVPVFFDVAPPDCLVRDIVEKQGDIWEVEGGELWKVYMGEEDGWLEAVKGLLMVEDWRVEAYRKNWRESIQQIVSIVGSKLGRTSITDSEKIRIERAATEEIPWPRNVYFAGREKELKLLEKILFANTQAPPVAAQTLPSRRSDVSSKAGEGEETEPRLSNYDSENHDEVSNQSEGERGRDHAGTRRSGARRPSSQVREKRRDSADRKREGDRTRYTQTCIVTGIPGIGKSELALEFCYRHAQKYRMVLWVGGESRYLRQSYLNLSTLLGVNVGTETGPGSERRRMQSFDEQEAEALQRVRHELQKDIPYLLVIDNLDMERDSWDGRELSELLPRPGSATHVIITTRLPRVMHLDTFELPYLSSFEALTLMRDGKKSERSFSVQQIDKFKEFEDKLRRLPFGLAIVGRLINEFNMKPSEILAKMGTIDTKRTFSIERDDVVLRCNPFLVKLLDVCFNLMGGASGAKSLAIFMAYVGGWFGPAPCPLSLLTLAAKKLKKELGGRTKKMLSCWISKTNAHTEADARDLLTRLGLARASMRPDCLYFPDIIQVYCQKRGGAIAARSFVRAILKSGSVVHNYDQFWAAAYLVCRYGSDPAVVEFQAPDLLDFTRRLVMPLAIRAFNNFSRCTAALEVLRLCYEMLEDVEKSYVSQIQDRWDRSLCWRRGNSGPSHQVDEYVWQDLTLLKALLLEARAKLLLRGCQYESGKELCRTCINIRTVMLGIDHPDTLAAQETLSKFDVRNRASFS